MRYYVISDAHAFLTVVKNELESHGFFSDPEPHKLIICGDLLDRGAETVAMQDFAMELMEKDQLIFIRGNHEDLMVRLLDDMATGNTWLLEQGESVHNHNGTWDSALRLADMVNWHALSYPREFVAKVENSPFCKFLLPAALDYFETEHYVFTHGWIPCAASAGSTKYAPYKSFYFNNDWRNADYMDWYNARWYNGMEFACRKALTLRDKTVVCGHFRTSYGHAVIDGKGCELGPDADYSTFYAPGIIALDGCIVRSGRVNCIVLED
jgi:serine/threonine protein phosphatase 1